MKSIRLRHHINPQTFVITLRQIARHLGINTQRILNWEKWQNILWVHIQGKGGYFVSYRKLAQWLAACCMLLESCRTVPKLNIIWSAIEKEVERYTGEAFLQLQDSYIHKLDYLSSYS